MRYSFLFVVTILLFLLPAYGPQAPEWGFFGHRRINRMAVFTLDPEMMPFFREHLQYLTDHAVDPDKRRYATKHEAVRHYIDLDQWGSWPYPDVPRDWAEALLWQAEVQVIHRRDTAIWRVDKIEREAFRELGYVPDGQLEASLISGRLRKLKSSLANIKTSAQDTVLLKRTNGPGGQFKLALETYRNFWYRYMQPQYYEEEWSIPCSVLESMGWATGGYCSEVKIIDHFSEHGILPYHLLQMQRNLTRAFENREVDRILRYAAEFGHYIGDAHVPLHTTANYNGQLTDQVGIHGFWESRLPEMMADKTYDYFVGKAAYIEDPKTYFWEMVLASNALVEKVLQTEKRLSQEFPEDQQYCYEDRLDVTIRTYCPEYALAWAAAMEGMVEERFRASIHAIGSVWYTAWVDAGQPDLTSLIGQVADKDAEAEAIDAAFQKGEAKGRKHEG